jgi:dihydrofolate synthase/folylpolyglutamate synthase
VGGQLLALRGLGGEYEDVFVPLYGAHQASNAAEALAAVELLLRGPEVASDPLDSEVVRGGFAISSSPGRMEVVHASPVVVVDAAHNLAGAEALVAALDESFPQRLVGLVGILADKDAEAILGVLEPVLAKVIITRSTSPRAIDPEVLGELARDVFGEDRVEVVDRLDNALSRAIDAAEEDSDGVPGPLATGVLATGSVTIAAEVRILLGRG